MAITRKNNFSTFFGIFLVSMLFIPPSIPYTVPEAEAAPMDSPADAITDLSLVSISKWNNRSDRNSITLSWSAPNDNGSPIVFYAVQVHEISGSGWTTLENDVYGTTYTHNNAATGYQFSYRVFAIAADGCNGSTSTFYNDCNESNILHVVSLPDAESGAPTSQCNNSDLDDCGYVMPPPSGTVSTSGINLRSDTGGDCSTVGTWNASTKTCTLTADISMTSNGVGILISSQSWQNDPTETGLILDGNGHTITGTGTSGIDHDGVRITGSSSNITVKNLTITNFKTGINSNFTNGLTITGVTVSSVGSYGIYLYGTDGLTFQSNNISGNVNIVGHNAYLGQGNGSCTGNGQYVSSSQDGPMVIKSNTITGNGLSIEGSGYCIDGNTISGANNGIYIAATSFNAGATPTSHIISNNVITGSQTGIKVVSNADGNAITANTIKDGLEGIGCSGSDSNTISGNTITNNKPSNFGLSGTSQAMAIGTCDNNTISNNQITNNSHGIEIQVSDGNTLSGNTISNNDGNGIRLLVGTGNILTNNIVNNNSGYGFLVESNSTPDTFTDNTASGNSLGDFEGISQESGPPYTIKDDSTGGDCQFIGTWSSGSKTCTLTSGFSVPQATTGIIIASSGVTIDGANHQISGTGWNLDSPYYNAMANDGIWINPNLSNVTIKNIALSGFRLMVSSYNGGSGSVGNGLTITNISGNGQANQPAHSIHLYQAQNFSIKNNVLDGGIKIEGNDLSSITGNGQCSGSGSSVIQSNNFAYMGSIGISLERITGICVDSNSIDTCSSCLGMKIYGDNHKISNNSVTNSGYGFVFENPATQNYSTGVPNTIVNNSVTNSGYGFYFNYSVEPGLLSSFSGNTASGNGVDYYGISIDTTPPVVTVPSNQNLIATLYLDGALPMAPFDWTPTATDDVGVTLVNCINEPGGGGWYMNTITGSNNSAPWQHYFIEFPVGTTTVTCTATDAAGNVGTASFTITVVLEGASDTTPPTISFGGFNHGTVHTHAALNSTGYNFTWETIITEVYEGSGSPSFQITGYCHAGSDAANHYSISGDAYYGNGVFYSYNHLFPIGTTTVTCSAPDAAGNTGSASFTVTVVLEESSDTTPIVATGNNIVTDDWTVIFCTAGAENTSGARDGYDDPNCNSMSDLPPVPLFPFEQNCVDGVVPYYDEWATEYLEGQSCTGMVYDPYSDEMAHAVCSGNCDDLQYRLADLPSGLRANNYHHAETNLGSGIETIFTSYFSSGTTHYYYNTATPWTEDNPYGPTVDFNFQTTANAALGPYTAALEIKDGDLIHKIPFTGEILPSTQAGANDTTPPTISFWTYDMDTSFPWSGVPLPSLVDDNTLFTINSTGGMYTVGVMALDDNTPNTLTGTWPYEIVDPMNITCTGPLNQSTPHQWRNQDVNNSPSTVKYYHHAVFPVGTLDVYCTATDAAGNIGTGSFAITVSHAAGDSGVNPPSPTSQNLAITGFGNAQGHSGYLRMDIGTHGIYVADSRQDNVKRLDFSGNVLFTITSNISNPRDVAVDSNHNIYVSDDGYDQIRKFDPNGNYLGVFASVSNPRDIGIDSSGKVYVGSWSTYGQNYVRVFNSAGNQINSIPVNPIYALEVNPSGTFYISNFLTPTEQPWVVRQYSSSGTFQNYIGSTQHAFETNSPDTHSGPYCIGVYSSKVYVCEQNEGVVKIFDTSGNLEKIIYSPSTSGTDYALDSFGSPSDVVLDSVGNIYIADPVKQRILVFPPGSGEASTTTPPTISFVGFNEGDNLVRTALNSTGYNVTWSVYVEPAIDVPNAEANIPPCVVTPGSVLVPGIQEEWAMYMSGGYGQFYYNHLFSVWNENYAIICYTSDAGADGNEIVFTLTVLPSTQTASTIDLFLNEFAAPWGYTDSSAVYFQGSWGPLPMPSNITYNIENSTGAHPSLNVIVAKEGVGSSVSVNNSNNWNEIHALEDSVACSFGDIIPYLADDDYPLMLDGIFPPGTTTVTCTATDTDGSVATTSLTVTVNNTNAAPDTTPPVLTIPGNVTVTTNQIPAGAALSTDDYGANWPPSATDDTAIEMDATCESTATGLIIPGSELWIIAVWPVGTTTVTCTATDAAGNVGTASFTVTVELPVDTTPPTISFLTFGDDYYYNSNVLSSAITISTTNSTGGMLTVGPAAVDDTTVNTLTYEGAYPDGNYVDLMNITCTGQPIMDVYWRTWDDNPIWEGVPKKYYFHAEFPVGTTTMTCTATDEAGNVGSGSLTVTVQFVGVDESPPVISQNNINVQTTNPAGMTILFSDMTVTDNISVTTGPNCDLPSGSFFSIGLTIVTCTASDGAGNVGTVSFTVTVDHTLLDITPPAIGYAPNEYVSTNNPTGIVVDYAMPTVNDNVEVLGELQCTPPSGSLFSVGSTTVVCTASDTAGNVATTFFTVTVVNTAATGDNTAPTFATVNDITVDAMVANGAEVFYATPAAADNEGITFGPVCTPPPGSLFPVGYTIVSCIASDAAGNAATTSFTVTVESMVEEVEDIVLDDVADLMISSVSTTDTSFSAGSLGYFTTSIASNSTSSVLVTISVQDTDETALGVGYLKYIVSPGDSDITLGFQIPDDALSGDANVFVNVWSDWLPGGTPLTEQISTQVEIIGAQPPDLGAFDYYFEYLPSNVYLTDPGFTAGDIVDGAVSYWKGSPPVETFNTWSDVLPYNVNSYADSKVPFGSDFVTDLKLNEVDYYSANLNVYWVKEYGGGTVGIAPISDYSDELVDNIFIGLGDSNYLETWQPYSEKYLTETMQHELGHVIGFAHDDNPNSLMYYTSSDAYPVEYGVIEKTFTLTGGYGQWVGLPTIRDVTNFNYHVSTDNEAGFDVYFAPDYDTVSAQFLADQPIDSYPGCFDEDMMSTGIRTCNGVAYDSGLYIVIPLTEETAGILSEYTVRLEENFDGTSNAIANTGSMSTSSESSASTSLQASTSTDLQPFEPIPAPIIPSVIEESKVEVFIQSENTAETQENELLLEISDLESKLEEEKSNILAYETSQGIFKTRYSDVELAHLSTTYRLLLDEKVVAEDSLHALGELGLMVRNNSVLFDGANYVSINDQTLNQDIEKFTISGWINPSSQAYALKSTIISKYKSFNLNIVPAVFENVAGKTVMVHPYALGVLIYDGSKWHDIVGKSEVTANWHHFALVVDGSVASLYFDGKLEGSKKLTKEIIVGSAETDFQVSSCADEQCLIDSKMQLSSANIVIGAYIDTILTPIVDPLTHDYGTIITGSNAQNIFTGIISSVNIFQRSLEANQITELYEREKSIFIREEMDTSKPLTIESPMLPSSDCLEIAKDMGYDENLLETYTLVCQFPFEVIIPLNHDILWIETRSMDLAAYRSLVSSDSMIRTGLTSHALLSFYEPKFTYGVYEIYDVFDDSLTGKIIIPTTKKIQNQQDCTLRNSGDQILKCDAAPIDISIPDHGSSTDCGETYSCFDPFGLKVKYGDTVTWKNFDSFSHTVTSGTPESGPTGHFDSKLIQSNNSFSLQFNEIGKHDYYCTFHPWMTGTILVER